MIWTIIAVIALVLGVVGIVIDSNSHSCPAAVFPISFLSTLSGVIAVMCMVTATIINVAFIDINYVDKLAEREMLEYRIENCENIVGNELLYTDIMRFNEDLRHTKKWSNSLWTNWFYNWKIAEMDYINVAELESNRGDTK